MKKLFIALELAIVLLFSACGGDGGPSPALTPEQQMVLGSLQNAVAALQAQNAGLLACVNGMVGPGSQQGGPNSLAIISLMSQGVQAANGGMGQISSGAVCNSMGPALVNLLTSMSSNQLPPQCMPFGGQQPGSFGTVGAALNAALSFMSNGGGLSCQSIMATLAPLRSFAQTLIASQVNGVLPRLSPVNAIMLQASANSVLASVNSSNDPNAITQQLNGFVSQIAALNNLNSATSIGGAVPLVNSSMNLGSTSIPTLPSFSGTLGGLSLGGSLPIGSFGVTGRAQASRGILNLQDPELVKQVEKQRSIR